MDASVRTSNGLNPSQVIGHGRLMGALREPCSSRFPGDVFSQKGREAVGYDHRDKEAPIQLGGVPGHVAVLAESAAGGTQWPA